MAGSPRNSMIPYLEAASLVPSDLVREVENSLISGDEMMTSMALHLHNEIRLFVRELRIAR